MNDMIPSANSAVTASPPAALSSRPNALALAKALRRRWVFACTAGVICAGLAAAATWFLLPQKHTARTLLRVPHGEPEIVRTFFDRPADLVNHQRTQVQLVKSRLVLNAVLKTPRVTELSVVRDQTEPLEWLEKQVQADFFLAPEILRISMTGDRPQELAVLVDAVREAYQKEFLEDERLQRDELLNTLSQLREQYERQLSARKEEESQLQQKGISRDAKVRAKAQRFAEQKLDWAERDLRQTESDLTKARSELSALLAKENRLPSLPLPDYLDESVQREPAAKSMLAERERLKRLIDESIPVYTLREEAPHIKKLQKQLADKEKALDVLRREVLRRQLGREILALKTKISILQETRKSQEADMKQLQEQVQELDRDSVQMVSSRENVDVLEQITNRIKTEQEALRLKIKVQPLTRGKILEEGYATPSSGPSRIIASAMGGMGGLGFVFLAVSWWEFRARRIQTVDEVIQGLGLRLAGAIPDYSHRWFVPRARRDGRSQHLFVESIDTTRTILLEGARAESARRGDGVELIPQVVMVTSSLAGEGKTSLATHLAASLAQIGHKTLLVDADLRNPTAHRIIGLSCEPGCCELLRAEVELADVIRPTPIDRLWMTTGGRWDGRATRALAQPRTASIIQQLRGEFEFILIDSSPVLPVVDPLLLGRHADIVLLSVLCNVSRMKNVYTACQRLAMVGIRSLRAVISGVRGEDYDSSYNYFSNADIKV